MVMNHRRTWSVVMHDQHAPIIDRGETGETTVVRILYMYRGEAGGSWSVCRSVCRHRNN